ncbi:hypothetical protein ABMY26_00780 (plasmid) [Azospirillum sp. HJ39]|uniref:hypothetical protein n=1 Tax=Azospirillum sp. HJ39 TaxID=3159496 RepID=UPI0035565799
MTDISVLDTLRIENQATPASMAYHAARQPGPNSGLTAVTSIYTKQTAVALDGRPIGRIHALTDVVSDGNVYRAESYRVPGFWCGRSLWNGDGPDGYFLDPLAALSALIDDHFGEVLAHECPGRKRGAPDDK